MIIRVFLSFVEEDLNLVNLFRGQAKSQRSDLDFHDYSIKQAFNSNNAEYVGRGILDQLKAATLTICLYGPTTYLSRWVIWELNKTLELKKPIMGVSLYADGRTKYYPAALKGWPIVSWDISKIVATMTSLADQYRSGRFG
jgi:Thoeris protein ThsB, TIR-like domain